MLKRLIFGLFLMFFATPAMAQISAADFVDSIQPMVGKEMGDTDITLVSAKAEGSVVVILLDTPNWGVARSSVTDVFLTGFCEQGDESGFFTNKQLRVDTLEGGKGLVAGKVVAKCPE